MYTPLGVVYSSTTLRAQEHAELAMLEGEPAEPAVFNFRESLGKLHAYQQEHPEFAAGVATWMLFGTILLVSGIILFLFTEIKAVLVCRSQDFRFQLVSKNFMSVEEEGIKNREKKEMTSMTPRPFLSVGSICLMWLGLSCMMYPVCDLLDIMDLPAIPCIVLITVGTFFMSFCISTFWLAIVWSCTRPYAALVFLLMSVSGNMLLPTGNAVLVACWVAIAFFGGYIYFKYIPEHYDLNGEERPFWVQDVGDYTVSLDWSDWQDAVTSTVDETVQDVKNKMPEMPTEETGLLASLTGAKKPADTDTAK